MNKHTIATAILLGIAFLPGSNLFAEESNTNVGITATGSVTTDANPLIKARVNAGVRTEAKAQIEANRGEIKEMRAATKEELETKRTEARIAIDARKTEIKAKIAEIKAARKLTLDANAKVRVQKILETIFKRMNTQITKLTDIDTRIGVKISSLANAGVDVSVMNTAYVNAQALLSKAKINVEAAATTSIDQTSIETSKEALRAVVKTAEDSIKAAGEAYRKIVTLIPEARVETSTNTSVNTQ